MPFSVLVVEYLLEDDKSFSSRIDSDSKDID